MPATVPANEPQSASLLKELRAIRESADRVMARIADDITFSWQPNDGRGWSVGQCLDHLSQTNRLYMASIRDALANAPRADEPVTTPIASSWFGRKFAQSMEPGSMKMKAPKKVVPRSATSRQQVWTEFARGLDELEAIIRDADRIDLNRATFPSPLFKFSRVRAGTGFRIMLAHMRRHVRQAERVLETRTIEAPKGVR